MPGASVCIPILPGLSNSTNILNLQQLVALVGQFAIPSLKLKAAVKSFCPLYGQFVLRLLDTALPPTQARAYDGRLIDF